MTSHETAAVAATTDPCARLDQLCHDVNRVDLDADHLLTELRMHVNAIEKLPATEASANVRAHCVCELYLLLDRFITLGGTPPTDWLAAFRRASA